MRRSSDEEDDRTNGCWGPLNNLLIKMVVPGVMHVVVGSLIPEAKRPPPPPAPPLLLLVVMVVVMMAGVNKNFFMGKLGWTKDKE